MQKTNLKDRMWVVYEHVNKINGMRYIGMTSRDPEIRFGKNGCQYTKKKNQYFWEAIKEFGWYNFEHNILFENLSYENAQEKEKELIEKYHTSIYDEKCMGYNITKGGSGTLGLKWTEEQKRIKSESMTGEKNHFYGKHFTEEQKKHLSSVMKEIVKGENNPFYGKTHTDETKKKISDFAKTRVGELNPNFGNHKIAGENHPMYGKHLSEETRKKISESRKGIVTKTIPIICLNNNKRYNSIVEAANELGLDNSDIGKCCKGKQKSVKGYIFKRIDEYDNAISPEISGNGNILCE